jgi:two-component system, NarL family, sensor kinase
MKKSFLLKIYYVLFSIITFLFILPSCNNKIETKSYSKPAPVQLDSITLWLKNYEHVNDKKYSSVFTSHLKKQMEANNLDSVFKIIQYTTDAISSNYSYDTSIIDQVKNILWAQDKNLSPRYRTCIYNNLAKIFQNLEAHDSSILYAHKGMVKIEDYVTALNVGQLYNTLSSCYIIKAKYDSAILYGHKAEALFTEQKIAQGLGACYDNLSGLYGNLKDYKNEDLYLNKAITIAKEANIENGILVSYINRMGTKIERDDNKGALADADTIMKYYRQFKVTEPMLSIIVYSAKSLLTNINGDKVASKKYLDTAQVFLKQQPEYEQLDFYRLALLEQCKTDNNIASHKALFEDMLIKSQEQQNYKSINNIADLYYQEALKKKNYQEALKYKNMLIDANDSTRKEHQQQLVFDLDKKYQTAKKEKTIAEQNSKLENSKFQITILLSSLIGLSLITIAFFTYRKRKEAQAETKRQEEFTYQLIQTTEDERGRIASELHDGINHELLTVKNQLAQGKQIQVNDVEKIINDVRLLSRDLHPALFDTIGLAASIEALCERMTNEAGLFTTCEIEYTSKLNKRSELQLYRIIQEALNNTLKHGKANAAKVTLTTINNSVSLEVKDNGEGFNVAEQINSPKSFGLQSLLQRAKSIAGKLNIESTHQGTSISILIPAQ